MFNCAQGQTEDKLTTIYVSADPAKALVSGRISNSGEMFIRRTLLTGQNGTRCPGSNGNYINATYAKIDNAPDDPGYFSVKP